MKKTFLLTGCFALVVLTTDCAPTLLRAQPLDECDSKVSAGISVDQGHPWLPPFGLERVGSRPVAHVTLAAKEAPTREYYLAAYQNGREIERHKLTFVSTPQDYAGLGLAPTPQVSPPYFAHAPLTSVPSELVLQVQCDGRSDELVRQPITWPELEADATARPDHRINPVDLGTILPPYDGLLLNSGQAALIEVAAFSRVRDVPNMRLRAWFDGDKPVEISTPLTRNQSAKRELKLPLVVKASRTLLHLRLDDGARVLWKKDIRTMIVAKAPKWPAFGAVQTKLRYDEPILSHDPKTGERLPSIDYSTAWNEKFKDVVVFLPNGSRFVFWRGSNYVPFWAGKYNTGTVYQWAENCSEGYVTHPDGSRDCPEPLFDSELRYSRVRVLESSTSRVHVRWDYQLTDVRYEVRRGEAAEDFYFYPDGFGTRVVTVPRERGAAAQLTEFIIMTPQAAYPFDVLPRHIVEILTLDGAKKRIEFPSENAMKSVAGTTGGSLPPVIESLQRPALFRVFAHKDDSAAAIYFHPSDPALPNAYPPMYDQGQLVAPVYWGNHWPLNRGKWTGWAINDEITIGPGHSSVAGWSTLNPMSGKRDWEVKPLNRGEYAMPDARGQVRVMDLPRFVWMIAQTDLPDEALRDWGKSFSAPPAIAATGARLDIPSYSPERRALRLVAEQSEITIRLTPAESTVNPVFEIDQAPRQLAGVTLDGKVLPTDDYAWDGKVLWIKVRIGAEGATIGARFR